MRLSLTRLALSLAALALLACISPPRERLTELAERAYPTCAEGEAAAPERRAQGELRSGDAMASENVRERFSIGPRDCHVVLEARQEWVMSTTELEVVFDRDLLPLRAWKRTTSAGPQPIARRTDVRSYDLRATPVEMRRRTPEGVLELFRVGRLVPRAIIGPGRGLITAWLWRARLEVGGRLREPVLDIRERIEIVREATLMRLPDQHVDTLGRTARVYTIYGREPIFADDDDVVIGDLMGLVSPDHATGAAPVEIETDGPADPRRPL